MTTAYQQLTSALRKGQWTADKDFELHIVGVTGTEGTALVELICDRLGDSIKIIGHDFSEDLAGSFARAHVALSKDERKTRFEELMALPQLEVRCGEGYLRGIDKASLVFAGQNWRAYKANKPKLFEAHERVPFAQMMDLYLDLSACQLVGVTGTNGKTTTCNWIQHMARTEKVSRVSGNDLFSQQSLKQVFDLPESALLILEMSNRQLRDLHGTAPIAAVTSLAPDHVAEHGGLEGYLAAKRRIVELQDERGIAILNYDDAWVRSYADASPGQVFFASSKPLPEGCYGAYLNSRGFLTLHTEDRTAQLIHATEVSLPGTHNLTNALIASLAAYFAGVSVEAIRASLRNFQGVKNRLQHIARIQGVRFYNDLASTTPWSSKAALSAFGAGTVHLIVGGTAKTREGYDQLAGEIVSQARQLIAFPGTVTDSLLEHLPKSYPVRLVESIDEAVTAAAEQTLPDDVVLLSPAGAGFYSSYLGRFGSFNRSVRRLRRGLVA